MMNKSELLARWIMLFLVAGVLTGAGLARLSARAQAIEIHARMPEEGGWMPSNLTAVVGEPLRLRLTSDDVVHGFAIGQSDRPSMDIYPGVFTEVELTFDKPGTYTYYCTRWCGANHWRMRGTIEVNGPGEVVRGKNPALYLTLGMDIDAERTSEVVPSGVPSASSGTESQILLSPKYFSKFYYRTHSPASVWNELRTDPLTDSLSDEQVWNLVAVIWRSNTTDQMLEQGGRLYAENCAACHGGKGDGNGVMVDSLSDDPLEHTGQSLLTGHEVLPPADFTDPVKMLSASPALLQGKILRGGMGTGMPYWGPIFSEEQTWALVDYLYAYQFNYEGSQNP